ncbi:MAG: hypothetical protein P4M12_03390 [Gammaproteobacteria bacterium]|nr:hypothetical protein [Gammaproteobacteria bacterium]
MAVLTILSPVFYIDSLYLKQLTINLQDSFVLRRYTIQDHKTLNLGGIIFLLATAYVVYYLLLKSTLLPFSVSSLLTWSNNCSKCWHVLAVGLIPIYLGMLIFGAGVLSVNFGSALQRWLTKFWQ